MRSRSRGFTLLELMLVMLLIGVLLTLVGVGLTASPALQARVQAQELLGVIAQLRERAVSEGREYGLRFDSHSYQVMGWQSSVWAPLGDAHPLPGELQLRLELEGQPLRLSVSAIEPQLLILSSDEISPFALHYETVQGRWLSLSSDGLNDVVIHEG
ncbi:type II secretion system minor pseudopilin GspH [Pseudomonas sp. NPDC090202]|uniref:type II secretion system minor pseudopilin GspH n=1 Tax=unclassified Pseudomonas TaxID=196821 RepID=UPI003826B704